MNRREFLATCGAAAIASAAPAVEPIDADRWLEIDLYWFNKDDIGRSADEFWARFAPMFRGVTGWRGVILNVGWVMDFVLDWRGNIDDRIPIPGRINQEKWYKVGGQLTGDTAERMRKWKQRFSNPDTELRTYYQDWTYADLKRLVAILRSTAREKFQLERILFGSFVLGWKRIYGGEVSTWSKNHPEAYLRANWSDPLFNPEARLAADPTSFGAFTKGIPVGLAVTEFFGAQWGHLSKVIGLEALVLRDSLLGAVPYRRLGPWGETEPADPQVWSRFSNATADLVKATKQGNPQALVIGYSSAASAVGEWRVNGLDLEAIARAGFMDAYIDQTWAGAWNEVGVREPRFWNDPQRGWTYQLGFVLLHAAMLAGTRVRHYTLAETFDAWESWDIIHTAPDRLKWGIWSYLHAAVKTPQGFRMPAGTYISWANQGTRLLPEEDVSWLTTAINDATRDARQTARIFGPTLVYSRKAMEWQAQNAPHVHIGEWIDEQAAGVIKWSTPILSVTREEYLPQIETDLPILQTPAHLPAAQLAAIQKLIATGRPVAIFGSPAGGVDPELARLTGIQSVDRAASELRKQATLSTKDPTLADGVPAQFAIFHRYSPTRLAPGATAIYGVDGSPALVRRRNVLFWDPADIVIDLHQPMRGRIGSVYAFVLVARAISRMLGDRVPRISKIETDRPVCLHCWQLKSGEYRILLGNTEEGISDDADQSRNFSIVLPPNWAIGQVRDAWSGKQRKSAAAELPVVLAQAECGLLSLTPKESKK